LVVPELNKNFSVSKPGRTTQNSFSNLSGSINDPVFKDYLTTLREIIRYFDSVSSLFFKLFLGLEVAKKALSTAMIGPLVQIASQLSGKSLGR
jgi:hypothetical protein